MRYSEYREFYMKRRFSYDQTATEEENNDYIKAIEAHLEVGMRLKFNYYKESAYSKNGV